MVFRRSIIIGLQESIIICLQRVYTVVVRLWVHIGRQGHFRKISLQSINSLFMLLYVIEETFRIIFQPSFSKSVALGSLWGQIRTPKMARPGSRSTTFWDFRALNKLLGFFKLFLSERA